MVSALQRFALLVVLWWALTGGQGWAFGLPLSALLTFIWLRFAPPVHRVHLGALAVFGAYFLWRSCLAGIDVAARLLAPVPRISPVQRSFRLRLPPGPAQTLVANTLSLVPGTLSVALAGGEVILHCLDEGADTEAELRALEQRIAAVFGLGATLGDPHA